VGEPFADGEFNGATGFGPPQNVGRVFLISGADQTVIRNWWIRTVKWPLRRIRWATGQFGSRRRRLNGDGVPDVLPGVPHHRSPFGRNEIVSRAERPSLVERRPSFLLWIWAPRKTPGPAVGREPGDINSDGLTCHRRSR
jgi:hypothetical protein